MFSSLSLNILLIRVRLLKMMTMNKLEGTHLYAMKPLKDGFMIDL